MENQIKTQKEKAMEILNQNSNAKVEHLLMLDVFYIKDEKALLEWLPQAAENIWNYCDANLVYTGNSTKTNSDGKEDISEVYFRVDKFIDRDSLLEAISEIHVDDVAFKGIDHKSMVIDSLQDIYENLECYWSVDSYQEFYDFTDAEMLDIFENQEDAEIFSKIK
jgi:hypothetical protein